VRFSCVMAFPLCAGYRFRYPCLWEYFFCVDVLSLDCRVSFSIPVDVEGRDIPSWEVGIVFDTYGSVCGSFLWVAVFPLSVGYRFRYLWGRVWEFSLGSGFPSFSWVSFSIPVVGGVHFAFLGIVFDTCGCRGEG